MAQNSPKTKQLGSDIARRSKAPNTLPTTPNPAILQELTRALDGQFGEARDSIRERIKDDQFRPAVGLSLEWTRARTSAQLQSVLHSGLPPGAFREEQGGTGATVTTLASIDLLGMAALSLM